MFNNIDGKKKRILAILAVGFLLSTSFGIGYVIAVPSGMGWADIPTYIGPGSMVSDSSYSIFIDESGAVCAKNGVSGMIDFRNSNASYVIQSAINALPSNGGKVHISSGTYLIRAGIVINKNFVTLEGEHPGAPFYSDGGSQLHKYGNFNMISSIGDGTNYNNIYIKDLTLLNVSGYGSGIIFSRCNLVSMQYLNIANFTGGAGIISDKCVWTTVDTCVIAKCGSETLKLAGVHTYDSFGTSLSCYPSIINNLFENCYYQSLSVIDGHNYAFVSNNFFEDTAGIITSCHINMSSPGTISGNYIYSSPGDGIKANQRPVSIINNIIASNVGAGVRVIGSSGEGMVIDGNYFGYNGYGIVGYQQTRITNNWFKHQDYDGVLLVNNGHTTISSNQFSNNNGAGINLTKSQSCIITDNNFYNDNSGLDNPSYGIWSNSDSWLSTKNIITGNQFDNMSIANAVITGINNTVANNIGISFDSKGAATILSGQTSVTVYHDLYAAPSYVLATGSTADTSDVIVSSITSTYFVLSVPIAVGGNRAVYWEAYV